MTVRRVLMVALVLLVGAALAVVLSGTEVAGRASAKPYTPDSLTPSNVQTMCRVHGGQLQVRVYFGLDEADENMHATGEVLRDDPRVADVEEETQAQAYERFKEIFADQPELLELARPDSLPASLGLVPADDVGVGELAEELRTELTDVGVDEIVDTDCRLPE